METVNGNDVEGTDAALDAAGLDGDIDAGLAEMLREKFNARGGADDDARAVQIKKPNIDHLPDGVVSGSFEFNVGDRVVVERHTTLIAGRPWLDTKMVIVTGIDRASGLCRGVDLETKGYVNFSVSAPGYTVKLPARAKKAVTKRVEIAPGVVASVVGGEAVITESGEVKKRRGRPKGSKNRPRDVIVAERAEKSAQRAAKKIARRGRAAGGSRV